MSSVIGPGKRQKCGIAVIAMMSHYNMLDQLDYLFISINVGLYINWKLVFYQVNWFKQPASYQQRRLAENIYGFWP